MTAIQWLTDVDDTRYCVLRNNKGEIVALLTESEAHQLAAQLLELELLPSSKDIETIRNSCKVRPA